MRFDSWDAAECVAADSGRNPILQHLDALRLPWRVERRALIRRHPVRLHDLYGWEAIPVETAQPLVGGLIGPLWAQALALASPELPATYYAGSAWYGDDPEANLNRVRDELTRCLGEATVQRHTTAWRCEWKAGPACVRAMAWSRDAPASPPDWRDPRLAAACTIEIETGYRPKLSPQERGWIEDFVPHGQTGFRRSEEEIRRSPASEADLEFIREPPERMALILGRIGGTPTGEALIACTSQLHLVPKSSIVAFRLEHIRPARGPGGARLTLACLRHDGAGSKRLLVARARSPTGLDRLAADLAARWSRPCDHETFDDD